MTYACNTETCTTDMNNESFKEIQKQVLITVVTFCVKGTV